MGVVFGNTGWPQCRAELGRMIYLASTSPRRKKILRDLGVRFKILKPTYFEKNIPGAGPAKLVRAHALGKALSASRLISEGKILSADTVVYFKKKIIGKPKNIKNAFQMLLALQGKWHEVYTGVVLLETTAGKIKRRVVMVEKTKVRLRSLGRKEISLYFKKINPLDKAGAYAIQVKKGRIVEEVKGSFSNAVGLPVERLKRLID